MNTQLLWDGLKAMILGMGMVYVFLIIMIWIMQISSKLLQPYAKYLEPAPAAPKAKRKNNAAANGISDRDGAAAAIAAVQTYLKNGSHGASAIGVPVNGKTVQAQVSPAGSAAPAAASVTPAPAANGECREIKSPLPGTMVRINVSAGEHIASGDVLAVIEAMKMETDIRSDCAGVVRDVLCDARDVVASEQTLFTVEVEK